MLQSQLKCWLQKIKQAYAVLVPGPQLPGDVVTEENIFLLLCLKRLSMWAGMKAPTVNNLWDVLLLSIILYRVDKQSSEQA